MLPIPGVPEAAIGSAIAGTRAVIRQIRMARGEVTETVEDVKGLMPGAVAAAALPATIRARGQSKRKRKAAATGKAPGVPKVKKKEAIEDLRADVETLYALLEDLYALLERIVTEPAGQEQSEE